MSLRIDNVVKGNIVFHDHPGEDVKGGSVGGITPIESVQFDILQTTPPVEGQAIWNDDAKTLELGLKNNFPLELGMQLVELCVNNTGTTIAKGKVVYINGGSGNRPTITLASNPSDATSARTFGVTANSIADNNSGYVIVKGLLTDIDTNAYTAGTQLYLATNGDMTSTKPQAPDHMVYVAKVISQSATGILYVDIMNGYELDELHDVRITSVADKQIIYYDNATSLWKNATIPTVLGYTPENVANKGVANGYASLDSSAKVPIAQLPSSIMEYKGAWNASTNSPTLIDGTGDTGDVYRVSVDGTQNLGSGNIQFFIGDFVIYNGSIWQRSPAGGTSGFNYSQIDASGGTSDTYGILAGSINGSNKVFTTSYSSYVSGSLQVYLNGQLQTQGSGQDWQETAPLSGTFTFTNAPVIGDEIIAFYKYSTSISNNADTLDGYEGSAFALQTNFKFGTATIDFGASGAVTKTHTVNEVGFTSSTMVIPTILAEATTNNSADDISSQPLEIMIANRTTDNFDIIVNSLVGIFNYEVKIGYFYKV